MAEKAKMDLRPMFLFIALGAVLGAIAMVIFDGNIALGIGGGSAAGTAIGAAVVAQAQAPAKTAKE